APPPLPPPPGAPRFRNGPEPRLRGDRPGRIERLRLLATVPVDRHRLEPELPGLDVRLLDVLDGGRLGHVDGLRDGSRDERLHRAHHPEVAERMDRARTPRR